MVESKTINKKEEISYYRVFGWRKVGEYHGPAMNSNSGLVSVDGKVLQKTRDIDEYYLRRDMADKRYKQWIANEKEFKRCFNLAQTTHERAEKFIARKTRKFAVILFGAIFILSILALIACVAVGFFPEILLQDKTSWGDAEWQKWIMYVLIAAGSAIVLLVTSAIVLHCNKSKTQRKLPKFYKDKYEQAFKNALELSNVSLDFNYVIKPIGYDKPTIY